MTLRECTASATTIASESRQGTTHSWWSGPGPGSECSPPGASAQSPVSILTVTPQHAASSPSTACRSRRRMARAAQPRTRCWRPAPSSWATTPTTSTRENRRSWSRNRAPSSPPRSTSRPTAASSTSCSANWTPALDECATQQVLMPTGCPFGKPLANRVEGDPQWSIAVYPKVDIIPGERAGDLAGAADAGSRAPEGGGAVAVRRHAVHLRRGRARSRRATSSPSRRTARPPSCSRTERLGAAESSAACLSRSSIALYAARSASPSRSALRSSRFATFASLRLHMMATVIARIAVGISPTLQAIPPPTCWSAIALAPQLRPIAPYQSASSSPVPVMQCQAEEGVEGHGARAAGSGAADTAPGRARVDADERLHEQVSGDQEVHDHPLCPMWSVAAQRNSGE